MYFFSLAVVMVLNVVLPCLKLLALALQLEILETFANLRWVPHIIKVVPLLDVHQ
jgi:hypothetical protein